MHRGALAVYALGDVALEGVNGWEVFEFHTSTVPALRGGRHTATAPPRAFGVNFTSLTTEGAGVATFSYFRLCRGRPFTRVFGQAISPDGGVSAESGKSSGGPGLDKVVHRGRFSFRFTDAG